VSTDFKTSGWEQVAMAIEEVGDRLRRATQALATGSIPYAVAGGNAVAEWVGRIDRAAVRFTQDIDILLRREDLPQAVAALEQAGFVFRHAAGLIFSLTVPTADLAMVFMCCLPARKSANTMRLPPPALRNPKALTGFASLL